VKHLSLFSGIGGFDYAAEQMGWQNVACVEIDEFCQKVLRKNFPKVNIYNDIIKFNKNEAKKYQGSIDIISGGFPCQPFSNAGRRKGESDERYLWSEMLGTIKQIQPHWVVAENVGGIISIQEGLVFNKVITDLENEGYQVQTFIIPACSKNAPHRRDRVWFVAYSNNTRCKNRTKKHRRKKTQGGEGFSGIGRCSVQKNATNTKSSKRNEFQNDKGIEEMQRQKVFRDRNCTSNKCKSRISESRVCGMDDGFSYWMDRNPQPTTKERGSERTKRLKALGNAIVPQIALEIFNTIDIFEKI
jgi:DNA (cytosine-5)-methyltransferase 1